MNLRLIVGTCALIALALGTTGMATAKPKPPAEPVEMSVACAAEHDGLMRYVTSASKCHNRSELAITIKPGPVETCVRGDHVFLTSSDCTGHHRHLLTLPPASENVYFCAQKHHGTLRSVHSATHCHRSEFAVVVTPNNRPPDAVDDYIGVMDDGVYPLTTLDVLDNDSDPDLDALTITALGSTSEGIPTISGGGTAISYDADFLGGSQGQAEDDVPWTYTISDGHGGTDTATVHVRVWGGLDLAARCVPLTVSPDPDVQPGDIITVSGTSATANASIEIEFNGVVIKTTTSGDNHDWEGGFGGANTGHWSTLVTIPADAPIGPALIQGVQRISYTQPEGCLTQYAGLTVF